MTRLREPNNSRWSLILGITPVWSILPTLTFTASFRSLRFLLPSFAFPPPLATLRSSWSSPPGTSNLWLAWLDSTLSTLPLGPLPNTPSQPMIIANAMFSNLISSAWKRHHFGTMPMVTLSVSWWYHHSRFQGWGVSRSSCILPSGHWHVQTVVVSWVWLTAFSQLVNSI